MKKYRYDRITGMVPEGYGEYDTLDQTEYVKVEDLVPVLADDRLKILFWLQETFGDICPDIRVASGLDTAVGILKEGLNNADLQD